MSILMIFLLLVNYHMKIWRMTLALMRKISSKKSNMKIDKNIEHNNDKTTPEEHVIDFLKNYFANFSINITHSIINMCKILITSIFESKVVNDLLQQEFFKKNYRKMNFLLIICFEKWIWKEVFLITQEFFTTKNWIKWRKT